MESQVRQELARLLASPQFRDAERLKRFLRYVVEMQLAGSANELKESLIGIYVFDRNSGFDPKQDPIVRVTARRVRDKLEQCYAESGAACCITIRLPKGSYVPEWDVLGTVEPAAVPQVDGPQHPKHLKALQIRSPQIRTWLFLAMATVVAAGVSTYLLRRREFVPPNSEAVSRFTIELGRNEQLDQYYGNNLAFSPDGRSLAYVASENGTSRLMIRDLSETASRFVAGSEGAKAPLYSPDGRSIIAYVPGHLKRFFVSEGNQDIASVSPLLALFGAAWDGERLLYDDAPQEVREIGLSSVYEVVPGSKDKPRRLAGTSEGKPDESQMIQQTLPEGAGYLLSIRSKQEWVALASRTTKRRKLLVENARGALYLSQGYLVFWSGGDLKAAPMSLSEGRLTGPQVTVVRHVGFSGWEGAEMAVSPSGTLAYVERASAIPDRRLAWVDHRGKQTPLPMPAAPTEPLSVSPSGQNLLLARFDRGEQRWTLWNYSLANGSSLQLTEPLRDPPYACWSPDGRFVAYVKRTGDGPSNVFVHSANGLQNYPERQVTRFQTAGVVPYAWSRDGKWLLATRGMLPATKSDIFAIAVDGGVPPRAIVASPEYEFNPDLSPDGRWIAYQQEGEVYVRAFLSGPATLPIHVGDGAGPIWDPSGRMLYYVRGPSMMALPIRFDPNPTLGTPSVLFTSNAMGPDLWIRNILLSRDGKRFLMSFAEHDASEGRRINVVVNWFADLRRFFHPQG